MRLHTLALTLFASACVVPALPGDPAKDPTADPATPGSDTPSVDGGQDDPGAGDTDAADIPASSDCPDDVTFFEQDVWTPVLQQRCVSCHKAGGPAGTTRLVLTPGGADPEGDFEVARAVALIVEGGQSILRSKPTSTHAEGHGGGRQVAAGSVDDLALIAFIDRMNGIDPCLEDIALDDTGDTEEPADTDTLTTGPVEPTCGVPDPGPRRLRRLSHVEYDRTVRDLLGIDAHYGDAFAPDVVVEGFLNNGDVLEVDPLLADQYRTAAEALALDDLADVDALLPCDPDVDGPRDCASEFLVTFGKRAFRRPLTTPEHDRYLAFHDEVRAEEGFEEATRWTLAALLQSPHFLYRAELGARASGNDFALSGWELATELSYLVWGSMPDQALFDAAEAGELATHAGRVAQVERLLADPRASDAMSRFTQAWLRLDQLENVSRDAAVYPELDTQIRAQMNGQTRRFVDTLFLSNGTFDDLMSADFTFTTDYLADYYGMPRGSGAPDSQGFRRTPVANPDQRGLLGLGALLTTYANPTNSSPVHRGVVVRERLLCQHLPPPPPNLNISPPAVDPNATTRERYDQHRSDPACAGCHELIDPVGFGFEHFDGIGRWRTEENGLPIDATGTVHDIDGTSVPFDSVAELAQVLAGSDEVHACYARQWVRYGHGLTDDATTACRAEWLDYRIALAGGRLADVLVALVEDLHFSHRVGGPSEADAPGLTDVAEPLEEQADDTGTAPDDPDVDTGNPFDGVDPRLEVTFDDSNDWGSGFCVNATVRNTSNDVVAWEIVADIGGNIYNAWNVVNNPLGSGTYLFQGVSWNAQVQPQGTVGFGFCANR